MTEEYKNAKIFEFRKYLCKEYGVNYRLPDVRYGIPNNSNVDKWRNIHQLKGANIC